MGDHARTNSPVTLLSSRASHLVLLFVLCKLTDVCLFHPFPHLSPTDIGIYLPIYTMAVVETADRQFHLLH